MIGRMRMPSASSANTRRAIRSDGTLLILEGVVDSVASPVGVSELLMLVIGGRAIRYRA